MGSIAKTYAEGVHHHWRTEYANWPVDRHLSLGDYGALEGDLFRRFGNIKDDFGIDEPEGTDPTDAVLEFTSSEAVTVAARAKGDLSTTGIKLVNAGLEVSFGSKDSIYCKTAGGRWDHFRSPHHLGTRIIDLYEQEGSPWQRHWVVVTRMLTGEATTVIASLARNASILIEAEADDVPTLDLASASVKVDVKYQSNIGLKVIAERGMIPLIGLMKIQRKSMLGLGLIPIGIYWGPEN